MLMLSEAKTIVQHEEFMETDSPDLAAFMEESRKYQTLYSCCEGYHSSRTFKFNEEGLIEEFITCTMFFKKCIGETGMLDMDEKQIVKSITERIIKESRKYNCEVCFGVIWVYYFVYHEKKSKRLPIFKIYNGKNKEKAIYLDTFLNIYRTWDSYIDNSNLGKSLLCIPRNGEYCIVGDLLNLEYVLSKSVRLELHPSRTSRLLERISPFCEVAILPWIRKIHSWLSNHLNVREAVKKCSKFCKEYGPNILSFSIAILAVGFAPEFINNPLFPEFSSQAVGIIFMLINSLMPSKFSATLESVIKGAITSCGNGLIREARELSRLLSASSKNWFEILQTFCCFLRKCKDLGSSQPIRGVEPAKGQNLMAVNERSESGERVNKTFADKSTSTSDLNIQEWIENQRTRSEGITDTKEAKEAEEKAMSELSLLEPIFDTLCKPSPDAGKE